MCEAETVVVCCLFAEDTALLERCLMYTQFGEIKSVSINVLTIHNQVGPTSIRVRSDVFPPDFGNITRYAFCNNETEISADHIINRKFLTPPL